MEELKRKLQEILDDGDNYTSSYTGTPVFYSERALPKVIEFFRGEGAPLLGGDVLAVPDIRNKLSPVTNLVAMLEAGAARSKEYKNIPPKEIMNAMWGACFDYKDFEEKILDETIRDRVYDAWQRIHQCIDGWINADEKNFLDYIKQNKPDLEQ